VAISKQAKATRVLALYQRLMNGEAVYKSTFCMEFEVEPRTFDRYIENIRIFLSESFSWLELIYDRKTKGYRLKNLILKPEMGLGGCFILAKLILNSRTLRTDDQSAIVDILLSQLRPEMRERARSVLLHTPILPNCLTKASVKLVEDLLYSIECSHRITLHFGETLQSIECVPYSVEFQGQAAYLAACELASDHAILCPLDDIQSYVTAKEPYLLSFRERETLQLLVANLCRQEPDKYQPCIYRKEEKKKNDNI